MYKVKILKDSVNIVGNRLTTFELTYPRFVHAELMTHRLFSRNSGSSRAIPNKKLRQMIADDPAMPVYWGKNQSGMQAAEELDATEKNNAIAVWLEARDSALAYSEKLADMGVHKQICNRIIEPWMFITVIVSATEFDNWFFQRTHKDAQPEIAHVAREMKKIYDASSPQILAPKEWHMPLVSRDPNNPLYVSFDEADDDVLKDISVGRCARVSYLTHDGQREISKDIELFQRLAGTANSEDPPHMSPFEHVAMALGSSERFGNFFGFLQYRKQFANEHRGKQLK